MIEISYEINGRKVNPRNMKDALESAVLESVADSVKKDIGSLICSEHGKAPKIKIKGRNLDNLSFEISGCCDNLIKKVEAQLN